MISNKEYQDRVKRESPKSREIRTLILAFVIGGTICCIGEGIGDILKLIIPSIGPVTTGQLTSCIMIFLGSLLTGIGVYDKIGKVAGAGSIVPITGFANSIVSPAMEYNREGYVLGVMSRMFVVAGPIIVSGVLSSIAVGLIYWIVSLF